MNHPSRDRNVPTELLTEIFMHARPTTNTYNCGTEDTPNDDVVDASPNDLIRFTHVCSRWREAALRAANLWTIIWIPCPLSCMQVMLRRSRNLPLSIKSWGNDPSPDVTLPLLELLLQRELPRIVHLDVWVPHGLQFSNYSISKPDTNGLSDHLALPLAEVVLRYYNYPSDQRFSGGADAKPLLGMLGEQMTPFLERVSLHTHQFSWPILKRLPMLKHLIVCGRCTGTWIEDQLSFEVDDILQVLEALPLLETLRLDDFVTHSGRSIFDGTKVVALTTLKKLCLSGSAKTCYSLLRYLGIKPHTFIHIEFVADTIDNAVLLLSRVRRNIVESNHADRLENPPPPLHTIDLRTTVEEGCAQIRCWTTVHTIVELTDLPDLLPEPLITLIMRDDCPDRDFSALSLLKALPTSKAATILVAGGYCMIPSAVSEWEQAFQDTPCLRELGLAEFAVNHLLQILSRRASCDEVSNKGNGCREFLPSLKLLFLQHSFAEFNDKILRGLCGILRLWKENGLELQGIIIRCLESVEHRGNTVMKSFEEQGLGSETFIEDVGRASQAGDLLEDFEELCNVSHSLQVSVAQGGLLLELDHKRKPYLGDPIPNRRSLEVACLRLLHEL